MAMKAYFVHDGNFLQTITIPMVTPEMAREIIAQVGTFIKFGFENTTHRNMSQIKKAVYKSLIEDPKMFVGVSKNEIENFFSNEEVDIKIGKMEKKANIDFMEPPPLILEMDEFGNCFKDDQLLMTKPFIPRECSISDESVFSNSLEMLEYLPPKAMLRSSLMISLYMKDEIIKDVQREIYSSKVPWIKNFIRTRDKSRIHTFCEQRITTIIKDGGDYSFIPILHAFCFDRKGNSSMSNFKYNLVEEIDLNFMFGELVLRNEMLYCFDYYIAQFKNITEVKENPMNFIPGFKFLPVVSFDPNIKHITASQLMKRKNDFKDGQQYYTFFKNVHFLAVKDSTFDNAMHETIKRYKSDFETETVSYGIAMKLDMLKRKRIEESDSSSSGRKRSRVESVYNDIL